MMIMLLAGLQSLPKEVPEAAKVDCASRWQGVREGILPLMLPVSVTVILIRVIVTLKIADIIITVTSGGPGGAIESVTSFNYRDYRDQSNFGYGTLFAMVYLVAAFILSLVLCWNEYFFAALLTSTNANTLPVMVARQTGSQGINWWSMAALSAGAIAPLVVIGIVLERYIIKGMAAGAVK